jgi:hypothetical protein
MSEAASLPGTLFDEATAHTAARTRQDNWATQTVEGTFTEVHRRHLERIDLIQPTMDFVKINAGQFTGKQSTVNGRTGVSFTKFLHNLKSIVYRVAANCPVQIDAVTHTESIINELRPGEETPQFITVFNQLVFNILLNASDEEAMNIVLQYEHSDDPQQTLKKDGRRALFALMQTYAPVSTNAGNLVKSKLEHLRFKQDKDTIQDQITEFYILIQKLEVARADKLESNELWSFVTSSIKGSIWASFRLTISMQSEFKAKRSFWFIDQVREYVLALEDSPRETSPPSTPSTFSNGRNKSILNAATSTSNQNSVNAELTATVTKLAAAVAAITTSKETTTRVKPKLTPDTRVWDSKMGPCRFCGGSHRHRDCHTLQTSEPNPSIPPRAGAVRGVSGSDDTPGFLMGVISTDQLQDECATSSFSYFVSFMAMLTAIFWFVISFIAYTCGDNIKFQQNLRIAVCRSDDGVLGNVGDAYCNFGVDTCASDHICNDMSKFSSINFNRSKTFEVVHGEKMTSSGVGQVTLNVATTSNITKELVLTDVHYIPNQRMSLISVGKAIASQGFESPDFKRLTWKVDRNCTLKLLKTSNTLQLDATVKLLKWTSSGVKVDRSGAQH